MDEFKKVVNKLALVDIQSDKGWFTWTNGKSGEGLVKERLDRFLVSVNWLQKVPFLSLKVVCQVCFDHDVMVLNTLGR